MKIVRVTECDTWCGETIDEIIKDASEHIDKVLSSGQKDKEWIHVSVSLGDRCPTWSGMCRIKDLFFGEEITVVQFHPDKDNYINNHKFCLHLWHYKDGHQLPPSWMVGIR